MNHAEKLTALISKHESRAEKLRTLQNLLADDPELMVELRQILFPAPPPAPKRVELVTAFLRKKSEWQTAREIAEGTDLPRNTVNFLLFASKKRGLFESKMQGPKQKVWKLKAVDDGIIRLKKPVKDARKRA